MVAQTALSAPWLGQRFLRRCTGRYGRTFRVNLYWLGEIVLTSDIDLVRELFITRKDGPPLASWFFEGSMRRMAGESPLLSTDGEDHKRNRRRLSEPLRELTKADADGPGLLASDLEAAVDAMPVGRTQSLWSVIEPVLFESVLRDALGVSDAARRERLRSAFTEYYAIGHRPELLDPNLARWLGRRLQRRFDAAEEVIAATIAEELALGPDDGFRAGLLEFARAWARDIGADEHTMCVGVVKGMVIASYASTTAVSVWTLLLLLHHPATLARLRAELAEGDRTLLAACVREAIRLFPPHPVVPWRRLTDTFHWGSLELPAGSVLAVINSFVHRDPAVYSEPNRFLPDRFVDGWRPPREAWLPFGTGLRRCLGEHWALGRAQEVVQIMVERAELAPGRPRLEPVWQRQQAHGPRWGGEVVKLRRVNHVRVNRNVMTSPSATS